MNKQFNRIKKPLTWIVVIGAIISLVVLPLLSVLLTY